MANDQAWHGLYQTAKWLRIAKHQLRVEPLCRMCRERSINTPASVCDHIVPHKGDPNLFWLGPFQSLCKKCHDSGKRAEELRGYRADCDDLGYPLDERHPFNRAGKTKAARP